MSASTLVVVVVLTVLQVWNESLILIVMTNSASLYTLPALVASGLGGTAALGASWLSIAPPLLVFLASQRHFRRGHSAWTAPLVRNGYGPTTTELCICAG